MENYVPPPPPPAPPASKPPAIAPQVPHHPLCMYNYDPPYNDFEYTYQYTSFPLTITLYNFNVNNTHLFIIITNNTISISPIYAAQNDNNNDDGDDDSGEYFPLVQDDNDEGVDNNNNNGVGEDHDLVLNDVDDDNDRAEFFDLDGVDNNDNNGAGDDHDLVLNDVDDDNDRAELVDLDGVDNNNNGAGEDHDLVLNDVDDDNDRAELVDLDGVDNNNNGAGEDHDLVLNDVDDDNDRAEFVDLDGVDNNNNNGAGEDHDLVLNGGGGGGGNGNGQAELSNLAASHYEHYVNFGPLRLIVFPDMSGLRHYGVRLTTLPTLPAYIHFDNFYYYNTTSLLINADTSVFVICPAPPLPVSLLDNAGNYNKDHTIYHAIALPFVLTLLFNIANTNTVISILIRISPEGVKVHATSNVGVTDSVAYVTMAAPET